MSALTDLVERIAPQQPVAEGWPNLGLLHFAVSALPLGLVGGRTSLKTASTSLQKHLPGCGVITVGDDIQVVDSDNGLVFALTHARGGQHAALTLMRVDDSRPAARVIGVTIASGASSGDELWPSLKLATSEILGRPPSPIRPMRPADDVQTLDLIYPSGSTNQALGNLLSRFCAHSPEVVASGYRDNPIQYLGYWARTPNRVLVVPDGPAHIGWMAPLMAYAAAIGAEIHSLRPSGDLEPWTPLLEYPERYLIDPLVFVRQQVFDRFLNQLNT